MTRSAESLRRQIDAYGLAWGETVVFYATVARREVVFLTCVVQAYEGLATLRTCLPRCGAIEFLVPRDQLDPLVEILATMAVEIELTVRDCRMGIPLWWGPLPPREVEAPQPCRSP